MKSLRALAGRGSVLSLVATAPYPEISGDITGTLWRLR
ncbi:MAG: hypothetical protein RL618_2289 [Pseudomonadota bacterium]|jgi:hypothetical protein